MNRRTAIRLGAFGALAAWRGFVPFASAQSKQMLKASDVHPAGYPTVVAVESLGKKLEAATNGRLGVQMFAAMQLGGEKEAIEQAQVGAIQFARVSVGALGPVIDELNVFNLPFLFRNTAHMQKVIDGPIGQELLDKVTGNPKAGLSGMCWMDAGARSVYDTKKPIKDIADLKGMKVRVMGNPDVRRHDERARRQRRRHGLRPGVQRAADRRRRWRREQSAELRVRQPLSGGEVLHARPSI